MEFGHSIAHMGGILSTGLWGEMAALSRPGDGGRPEFKMDLEELDP